jgi:hypothetical protein
VIVDRAHIYNPAKSATDWLAAEGINKGVRAT